MRRTLVSIVFLVASIVHLAFAQQPQSLTDLLSHNKYLTSFNSLLNAHPDILSILSSSGQEITLLAPSNAAFDNLPYSLLGPAFQNNDSAVVRSVIQYHILSGHHPSSSFNNSFQFLHTYLDDPAYANVTGGQTVSVVEQPGNEFIFVSGMGQRVTVTKADLSFAPSNVLHILDNFLIPPQSLINTTSQFNLTAFSGASTLNSTLSTLLTSTSDVTIFAPNNAAFQSVSSTLTTLSNASLSQLLEYHIIPGSSTFGPHYSPSLTNGTILSTLQGGNVAIRQIANSLFINSAKILQSDFLLSNGVVHVIDNILDPNTTAVAPDPQAPSQSPAIPGSAAGPNVPFTKDAPQTVSSAWASGTGGVVGGGGSAATTTGGSAATTTGGSAASSTTDGSTGATSTKKSDAVGRRVGSVETIVVVLLSLLFFAL